MRKDRSQVRKCGLITTSNAESNKNQTSEKHSTRGGGGIRPRLDGPNDTSAMVRGSYKTKMGVGAIVKLWPPFFLFACLGKIIYNHTLIK